MTRERPSFPSWLTVQLSPFVVCKLAVSLNAQPRGLKCAGRQTGARAAPGGSWGGREEGCGGKAVRFLSISRLPFVRISTPAA